MATPGPMNPDAVTAQVKRLINTQLRSVLKSSNLPVSGAKAAMQERIITNVKNYAASNNVDAFNRLRLLIYHPEASATGTSPSPSTARSFSSNIQPQQYPQQQIFGSSLDRPMVDNVPSIRSPVFKDSPFYTVQQQLSSVMEIKASVREGTRDTIHTQICLPEHLANQLLRDANTRIMIYSASDTISSPFQKCDVSFPYQIEIRINQDEIRANLRGLKNKPGSTRPADITNYMRKVAGYENRLQITYALTTKRYFMVVNLVKQRPVVELVAALRTGKFISNDRVIREMITKAEDKDIVATSSIMSLKCPLSTLRMEVPCRSNVCNHNQCFDATSYLQLQEQAPTWTCPICNKSATFMNLQVDQYVDKILKSTSKTVDHVIIEPNGNWSQSSSPNPPQESSLGQTKSNDGQDVVEIQELAQPVVKRETISDRRNTRSPSSSRRLERTSVSASSKLGSHKRSAGQVVDLTVSSDEEEHQRNQVSKRQFIHKLSNNLLSRPAPETAHIAHDMTPYNASVESSDPLQLTNRAIEDSYLHCR